MIAALPEGAVFERGHEVSLTFRSEQTHLFRGGPGRA
jgi:multiple sugar transport system ATP-binding protein